MQRPLVEAQQAAIGLPMTASLALLKVCVLKHLQTNAVCTRIDLVHALHSTSSANAQFDCNAEGMKCAQQGTAKSVCMP